jgi:hypothetical protein
LRGGSYFDSAALLAASNRGDTYPVNEEYIYGFRLAMIPEPSTGLLMAAGLLGLGGWRRVRT